MWKLLEYTAGWACLTQQNNIKKGEDKMLNVDDIMDALIDAELDDDYVPNEATQRAIDELQAEMFMEHIGFNKWKAEKNKEVD